MPGVRTSQGCQLCKQRKTKCDEDWPTCRTCRAARKVCSGPSSLLKFIELDGVGSSGRPVVVRGAKAKKQQQQQQQQTLSFGDTSTAVGPSEASSVSSGNDKDKGKGSNSSKSSAMVRLQPSRPPTTVADRVASRLAGLLKPGNNNGVCLQVSYLPDMPQRLARSDSLRDCAALFCSAWADYNRGKALDQLLATPLYPKAIRSLQRAINGPNVYTVETLAAMTLFERTGALFSNADAGSLQPHAQGIDHVFKTKGMLNVDDRLDLLLAFTNQWEMMLQALEGKPNFFMESPWKEALTKLDLLMEVLVDAPELICMIPVSDLVRASLELLPRCMREVRAIRLDPSQPGMAARKEALLAVMVPHCERFEAAYRETLGKAAAEGLMSEVDDPGFLLGRSVRYTSYRLAQAMAAATAMFRNVRRMALDLGAIRCGDSDPAPDPEAYRLYREACEAGWIFFPYAASLDPISGSYMMRALLPSLEAAEDGLEFDELAGFLFVVDRYQRVYPRDKALLRAEIVAVAKSETGRS